METIAYKKHTISIIKDSDPMNPRHEFDHIGKMVCFHGRYQLGDKQKQFSNPKELQEFLDREKPYHLPIYMYDHSGITIKTSPFSCPWDSGQIGFIYITKADMKKEFGKKANKKKAEEIMIAEVQEYDDYLTGNVYGYKVTDKTGEEIDSGWGYFGNAGKECAIAGAKQAIIHELKKTGEQMELKI